MSILNQAFAKLLLDNPLEDQLLNKKKQAKLRDLMAHLDNYLDEYTKTMLRENNENQLAIARFKDEANSFFQNYCMDTIRGEHKEAEKRLIEFTEKYSLPHDQLQKFLFITLVVAVTLSIFFLPIAPIVLSSGIFATLFILSSGLAAGTAALGSNMYHSISSNIESDIINHRTAGDFSNHVKTFFQPPISNEDLGSESQIHVQLL